MSNLLEQASLVMIPSGYKEDIVYSVIPTSGAGDLTFTRASNGTRIDSNGNVEVVPWNMLSNSEEFTSGNGWFANTTGGSTATQTSNYGVAPNGTTTADRIQLALNGQAYADWVQVPTTGIIVGQVYTYSIYIKSLSGTKTILFFNDSTVNVLKTITTEWVRYEYSWTATSTTIYPRFLIDGGTSSSADLLAWGYQINIGSTAKPYFPTTDRLNVPRLTYQNGGGGCPSLLLEKQSTNYLIYNTQIDNAAWVKARSTVTANATTSPDGTQNGDAVFVNSDTNTNHEVFQYGTGATEGWSAFFKANGYDFVYMFGSADPVIWFDLQNGVVGTQQSGVNGKITNYGNGWYRCEYYKNSGTNSIWGFGIVPSNGVTTIASPDTSKGVYFWGAQAEAGLYATSMIPTTSSSATRVADACYKTGISSLIGGTSGTVFFDITTNPVLTSDNYKQFFYYTDSSANQGYMYLNSGNGIVTNANLGNLSSSITLSPNTRYKIALTYANNDFALYVNGVSVATASSGTPLNFENLLSLGSYSGTSEWNQFVFNEYIHFPTRLTNSELAQLTGNQNYTINQAYESYGVASESPNCVQP